MKRTQYTVDHVHQTSSKPFAAVRAAFEAELGLVDEAPYQALTNGEDPQAARKRLEALPGPSGFTNFHVYDHGALLRILNLDRQALTYVVGNSLYAIEMTQFELAAALHAPLRVELYVDADGLTCVDYDAPTSLFGRFGDERINKVGAKIEKTLVGIIERALQ